MRELIALATLASILTGAGDFRSAAVQISASVFSTIQRTLSQNSQPPLAIRYADPGMVSSGRYR